MINHAVEDRLNVVIPAHDEERLLPSCLHAVLAPAGPPLRVVVVANGCTDATADVARAFRALSVERGHELVVVETPTAGKAAALNEGDRRHGDGPVLYLDADTVLLPGTLNELARTLIGTDQPLLSAPPAVLVRPRSRLARDVAAVWTLLPQVAGDVIGAGCYAVSAAGRARWGSFPAVIADDLFVRGLFAPAERQLTTAGGFLLVLPEGRELIRVFRRWKRGCQELRRHTTVCRDSDLGDAVRGWRLVQQPGGWRRRRDCLRPSTWPHWPGFVAAWLAARWPALSTTKTSSWERAECLRMDATAPAQPGSCPAHRPRVDVVVVTYRSADLVRQCLDSLRSGLAELRITVIDNASADDTVAVAAQSLAVKAAATPARLMRNDVNVGFGRAVNVAARDGDGDYILLVNPDVVASASAIDELVTLALRFPGAHLYGGCAVDQAGALDPTSCLAAPGLWHAVAFGLGLAAIPGLDRLDPDSLRGWRRDDVRAVPALTGAFLLIDRAVWDRLGGFDPTYVLYGEDVDFCLRARAAGCTPMFTHRAVYEHVGGASSTPDRRLALIMRGKLALYRRHVPRWQRPGARAALIVGVAGRAFVEVMVHRNRRGGVWAAVWRQRRDWLRDWPDAGRPCSTVQLSPVSIKGQARHQTGGSRLARHRPAKPDASDWGNP